MKVATICFLLRDDEICLGLKRRKFGADKYNGFGGKVGDKEEFKDETIEDAVKREGREEFEVEVKDIEKLGELLFTFPHNPDWDHFVHIYISRKWEGEPTKTEEMIPQWFKISEIPYNQMWEDDQHWLPLVLEGKFIRGNFEFDQDGHVLQQSIETLTEFGQTKERK